VAWTVRQESNLPKVLDSIVKRGNVGTHMITVRVGGQTRSPSENAKIIAIQKALWQRDPWYLTSDETKQIGTLTRAALEAKDVATTLGAIAHDVGRMIVRFFRAHIDARMSRTGATKPNSQALARRKGGKPPLRDTDELFDSLEFELKVIQ
jgi:hypothetical protein